MASRCWFVRLSLVGAFGTLHQIGRQFAFHCPGRLYYRHSPIKDKENFTPLSLCQQFQIFPYFSFLQLFFVNCFIRYTVEEHCINRCSICSNTHLFSWAVSNCFASIKQKFVFLNWLQWPPISNLCKASLKPARITDYLLCTKFLLLKNFVPQKESFENIKISRLFNKSKLV